MKVLVFLLGLVAVGSCGESSVSVNVKSAVNIVSDKFISYEMKFSELMDEFLENKTLKNRVVNAPAFIRLNGFTSYLNNANGEKFNSSDVTLLFELLKSSQIVPVFVIDYNSISFEPLSLLRDLKTTRNLKISECVWQLGNNAIVATPKKYFDDLKTLKIVCESVNKEHDMNWSVAADSSLIQFRTEKLPFEVTGYDAMKLPAIEIISTTNVNANKTPVPAWITVEETHETIGNDCNHDCLMSGLLHAQVLGEAAKKSFSVLFFTEPTNETYVMKENSFKKAVSTLHKKLVGSKVFNARVTKSSPDGKLMNFYSHCSKKTNGALTLMGINFSNMRAKFNVKISSPIDSNAVIMQYLLSAADGNVMLNNEKFNSDAIPAYKFKKLSKNSIALILPPFSMAFWTIKNSKINECLNIKENKIEQAPLSSSSSDQLLKRLVANELGHKVDQKPRDKRQLGGNGFLPSFELELPTFKFPNLLASASNPIATRDAFFSKNTDVYKLSSPDVNPLKSSENPSLPNGDVYLLINDGKRPLNADTLDYIIGDHEEPKQQKSGRRKQNKIVYQEATESADAFVPHDYIDAFVKTTKKSSKKPSKQEPMKEIGELFEAERAPINSGRASDQKSLSSNVELKTVIRELEPTYRQSKSAMLAAKRKWDKDSLMELLKDAQIEEVDKSQINDAEDFELIDLTENVQAPNYEEYEDDDDGFFDDQLHHIRTRRHADFAKNEIPKYGVHIFDDEEDSIESLGDDVQMYMQPRAEAPEEPAKKPVETTEQPITLKAIDFFSKSLGDAIGVAHKTFVGWCKFGLHWILANLHHS